MEDSIRIFLGVIAIWIGFSMSNLLAHSFNALASEVNPTSEARANDELSSESSDYSPSTVNGVSFQTVIDNPVLQIPEPGSEQSTPVRFGLQLTNNTEAVVRFGLIPYHRLFLQIFQSDGVSISQSLSSEGVIPLTEECPFVIQAGETRIIWVQASLFWDKENLRMQRWPWLELENLKAGDYTAQFHYNGFGGAPFCIKSGTYPLEILDDLWTGQVSAAPISFLLFSP
ncbi:MAG: hypothetical protein AAGG51_08145 [Cyanobacteria bacterium P01_G01_bin.54]